MFKKYFNNFKRKLFQYYCYYHFIICYYIVNPTLSLLK